MATELESRLGKDASADKRKEEAFKLMGEIIRKHKRIIFGGDNYSSEWHAEAKKRGLPNLKDCTTAIPALGAEKNVALFEKYKVLTKEEVESRVHIFAEKYAKEMLIESEAMVLIGRQNILAAALEQQTQLAQALSATEAAGAKAPHLRKHFEQFVDLVERYHQTLDALDEADNKHDPDASYMKKKVEPLMHKLRELADELETQVAADLWPLPSYRELLFVK